MPASPEPAGSYQDPLAFGGRGRTSMDLSTVGHAGLFQGFRRPDPLQLAAD
jgi:hypothetical protein